MNLKKCKHCGAIVKVINDCTCNECGVICCNDPMVTIIPNSEECAIEKHLPTYQVENDQIIVTVDHVMEEDHSIEWISLIDGNQEFFVSLNKQQPAKVNFPYRRGSTIYAYCNKHGLWKSEVE